MERDKIKESKEYKKAVKAWGENVSNGILSKPVSEIERALIDNKLAIQAATEQTKSNKAYVEAEEVLADFNAALRDRTRDNKIWVELASKILHETKTSKKST